MTPTVTSLVLIVTGVVTFIAFQKPEISERLIFNPYEILRHKQFERMLTSGLIHGDWIHFAFNAISFYSFASNIEWIYGWASMLLIYISSILGGSLLSLIIHRHHDYRALGASGGVCGVIFASIFLLPGGDIQMFGLPFGIPAYIYAIGFLLFSFVGHRRQIGRVGHDAHLGGAIIGLLVATALYPRMIFAAPGMFATVLTISVVILLALIFDPMHLLERSVNFEERSRGDERSREYDENRVRNRKKEEIDKLLDKVSREGIDKLSRFERKMLDELSKEIYGRN